MFLSSEECSDDSDSSTMDSNSDFDCSFKFPPPPRLTKSADISHVSSLSDSSNSDGFLVCTKRNKKKKLPPLGVFWDIENCQVPKFKSASAIVQRFRTFFLQYYREAEFLVVCDVKKEHPQIIQELHNSQVNLIHVSSISKNAADEKLRQSLRRFAECHRPPCAIVLISGDVNFAADLSDLRYRKKVRVILVHNANVADALVLCANDHYFYQELIEDLPHYKKEKTLPEELAILEISNLPPNCHFGKIKARLKILVDNCGGRVQEIHRDGKATIRFTSMDFAIRAQKRIDGEDVYGFKIRASAPSFFFGRRLKNDNQSFCMSTHPSQQYDQSITNNSWNSDPPTRKDLECNFFRPILRAQETPIVRIQGTDVSMNVSRNAVEVHDTKQSHAADLKLLDRTKLLNGRAELAAPTDEDPVELIISNLDSSIAASDLRISLANMLKKYVSVCSLKITDVDGVTSARAKVFNRQAAEFAVCQLQGHVLGRQPINISFVQDASVSRNEQLKTIIVSILQETPSNRMELSKFLTLIKLKYQYTMLVSELNEFTDICRIAENRECRIITLTQKNTNTHNIFSPYCLLHYPESWSECRNDNLPNVMIPFKLFADKLRNLLYTHMGSLPLQSFQTCYEQTFKIALPVNERGVALEHIISCVPDITIQYEGHLKDIKIIKKGKRKSDINGDTFLNEDIPFLSPVINLVCRELIDLLKTRDKCLLPLDKLVEAYHHHFGRQCEFAENGCSKLLDLLESLPHVIQILGVGTRRQLTLAHPVQMKRFTSDLLKVLKERPWKQIPLNEFGSAYEKTMKKNFSAVNYGLCSLEDLLAEIPQDIVVVSVDSGVPWIAVPKWQQGTEESEEFTCKVIQSTDEEKPIRTTSSKILGILGSQINIMLKRYEASAIFLSEFATLYMREFGYPFKSEFYGCETTEQVILKLSNNVQLLKTILGNFIIPLEQDPMQILKSRIWCLLLDPPYCKEVSLLKHEYQSKFNSQLVVEDLAELRYVLSISYSYKEKYISLTKLYILAAQFYHILNNNGGQLYYNDLERSLKACYGNTIKLVEYNIHSPVDLVKYFSFLIFLKGVPSNPSICINEKLSGYQILISQREVTQTIEPHARISASASLEFPLRMPTSFTPKMAQNNVDDFAFLDHRLGLLETSSRCSLFAAPDASDVPIPDKLIPESSSTSNNADHSSRSS